MIYQKIAEIMMELSEIGKIKREEIVPTMLPLLAKNKIVIKPREITDYKFMDNKSSFVASYELVDTEIQAGENINDSNQYESIIVQLPAGGCDQEEKGRSTYMASTGVYRQVLQQVFAIPILEPEDENNNNNNNNQVNNENINNENGSIQDFEEFEEDDSVTQNQENTKTVEDLTVEDIDQQFANF